MRITRGNYTDQLVIGSGGKRYMQQPVFVTFTQCVVARLGLAMFLVGQHQGLVEIPPCELVLAANESATDRVGDAAIGRQVDRYLRPAVSPANICASMKKRTWS